MMQQPRLLNVFIYHNLFFQNEEEVVLIIVSVSWQHLINVRARLWSVLRKVSNEKSFNYRFT